MQEHAMRAGAAAVADEGRISPLIRDIGEYAPLSPEEETSLSRTIHDPGSDPESRREAIRTLVRHNIRLAIRIAKDARFSRDSLDDLIQDGCLGLHRAAEKFDADAGVRFATYASYWIRQMIWAGRANRGDHRPFCVPIHVHAKRRQSERLAVREGITVGEAADRLGFAGIAPYFSRLDSVVYQMPPRMDRDDEGSTAVAVEIPAGEVDDDDRRDLARAIDGLPERPRRIVRLYYGFDRMPGDAKPTLRTVGRVFGLTRQRTSQIIARALDVLRGAIEEA